MKKNEVNFLEIKPIKLHLDYKKENETVFLIFSHNNILQKFLRWMTKKSKTSTLELNGLGTLVWENIDGENTVYDIINILLEKEEDKYESMQERVFTYLRILKQKKLIDFQ